MLNRAVAGTLKTRFSTAAFTFAFSGAILLASYSLVSNSAAARPEQGPPVPGTILVPDQHRAPAPRIVSRIIRREPQPLTPISSAPVISGPIVSAPAAPMGRLAPIGRLAPLRIDPAERQQIVASRAREMKREHCLHKLEARQRELRERKAVH